MKKFLTIRLFILVQILSGTSIFAQQQWAEYGKTIADISTAYSNHAIISDNQGGFFLVYEDTPASDSDIFVQWIDAAGNKRWGNNGITVTSAAGNQRYPVIAPDDNGGIYVAWQDEIAADTYNIYLQHLDAAGTALAASGGMVICSAAHKQLKVKIISDGSNGAILVWYDQRDGTSTDLYAQRVDENNLVQWTASGVPVAAAPDIQNGHVLVSDGNGGAIIAWQDTRNGNRDIYAQRILSNGINSWAENGIPVSTEINSQTYPEIVKSGSHFIITWADYRIDGGDIYAQSVDLVGNLLWTANGVPVCRADGTQGNVSITADSAGGALIAWSDNRYMYDIYGQRINSSGVSQWAADGIAIYRDAGSEAQFKPHLASDGANGAIAVWMDFRSNNSYDLYLQHVSGNGDLLYPAEAVQISSESGSQDRYHAIVTDNSGGSLVVWHDCSDNNEKIMAQLINSSIDLVEPAEDVLLNGTQSSSIAWSQRPEQTVYDHFSLHLSTVEGDNFPHLIQANISSATTSLNWTPASINTNTAKIQIRAHDNRDSVICTFESKVFRVDSSPPGAFDLIAPEANALTDLTPDFSWQAASDNLSGLNFYQLWIDDNLIENNILTTTYTLTAAQKLSTGNHTWFIKAFDLAGLSRQSSSTRAITSSEDFNPPTPFNLTAPDDKLWTSDSTPSFSWTASSDAESGLAGYRLFVNGSIMINNIGPEITSVTAPVVQSGIKTWYIEAFDSLGNIRSSETRTLKIDYVPPKSFNLSGPAASWHDESTITFQWQAAADTGMGLAAYQLWIDNQETQDSIHPDSLQYTLSQAQALTEGLHTWSIIARDSLGNTRAASDTFQVGVDITPPAAFSLLSPVADSLLSNASPSFSWQQATDAVSGIEKYQLWIDNTLNQDNISTLSTSVNLTLSEGNHSWQVIALDSSGNSNSSNVYHLTVDISAPLLPGQISPLAETILHTDKPVFLWHQTTDQYSTVKKFTLFINGQIAADNLLPSDTSFTANVSLANGQHHWKLRTTDIAGNTSETPSIYFDIECHHPVITSETAVTATEDQLFTYTAAWTDADNDDITLSFIDLPAWLSVNGLTLTGTPVNTTVDTLFHIVTIDPVFRDTFQVSLNILSTNDTPTITAISDITLNEDEKSGDISFAPDDEETAADQLILTAFSTNITLLPVDSITFGGSGSTRTLSLSPAADRYGESEITIIVSDGSKRDSSTFTCTVRPINDKPVINSIVDQSCPEDSSIKVPFSVTDLETNADQLIITFQIADTTLISQSGISVDGTGSNRILTLKPKENQYGQTVITILLSDSELDSSSTFTLDIKSVNDKPVFTSATSIHQNERTELVYSASAVDVDGDVLTFEYLDYPAWLTPSGLDIGGIIPQNSSNSSFKVTVNDGKLKDTLEVNIRVNLINDPPVFNTPFPEGLLRDIDTLDYVLNLDDYIEDPDDADSTLSWSWYILDSYQSQVSVGGNPQIAHIHGPGFQGILRIIFTASDPSGASASDTLKINSVTTDVLDQINSGMPREFSLYNNYPNPFNPTTTIRFGLPRTCKVSLKIYNTRGQQIATLIDKPLSGGLHEYIWDAAGNPSGIYIYRFQADNWQKTGRMLLMR